MLKTFAAATATLVLIAAPALAQPQQPPPGRVPEPSIT